MPLPIDSAFNQAPVVLTPPTGVRRASSERGSQHRRRKKRRLRDVLRADPTPWHLIAAAVFYWATPSILAHLQNISLPHELVFSGVVYLMWSGSAAASNRIASLFNVIVTLEVVAAGLLVASALLPRERLFAAVHATARQLYRYAFAVPLWTIIVGGLARIIADEVYALSGTVSWDLTPIFVKIEASTIERLQHAFASPTMSVFASNFYSAIWLAPLVLVGFVLAAANKPRTLGSVTIAYIVTAVSAVPLFVIFPLFDPWTTNRLYGAIRATTSIQYLVSNPSIPALTEINARYHWAAGAAFPSLHVAFPLVTALVLWRHRIRWASCVMAGMAAMSMFVVVYLGRNWIISTLAAVLFAFAVSALEKRIRLSLVLNPRHESKVVLRPGEVAMSVDPNGRAIEWYSAMFLFCAFAAVLAQIAWQRALLNIVGTGVPTAAVVSIAVMLGLAIGFFVGSRVSQRGALSLPMAISGAQLAVGLFGFVSMPLLHLIARATAGWGFAGPAMLGFLALLPPTILAGAMIPILLMNDVRLHRSVGDAVGRIAFAGALGAAAAAAFAALVLLGPLGLTATVQFSAVLNVGIGVLVYVREHRPILKR